MSVTRLLVLLLAAFLVLWNIWGYDLWAPDEPYFAEGAREMVADGHWAVPHVNGVVTTDKPPLFFWLIALISLAWGEVGSLTARLPSALAALATVILTMRLGTRLGGRRSATLAGLILATTYLFWDKGRTAQIDALLCLLILIALSAFESFRRGAAGGRGAGLLFWGAAALAVVAKGPVGFLLPLGIALFTLVFDRNTGAWRRFAPVSGPVLFLVLVGGWMALATLGSGGEYSIWSAFREHVLSRGFAGMHHVQPPWYYLKALPPDLLPWTFLLPGTLLLAWRRRGEPGDRFLLVWFLFVVLFFSAFTEKRDLYVLPAFPAFALLAARLVGSVMGWDPESAPARPPTVHRRWITAWQPLAGLLFLVVGVALPTVVLLGRGIGRLAVRREIDFSGTLDLEPLVPVLVLGAVLFLGGLVVILAGLIGRARGTVLATAFTAAAAYLVAAALVFPAVNPERSARAFALEVKEITAASRAEGHPVMAYHLGNLPEALAFYTGGIYFPESSRTAELKRHLASSPEVYAVADSSRLRGLPLAFRSRYEVVRKDRVGRRTVLLIRGR